MTIHIPAVISLLTFVLPFHEVCAQTQESEKRLKGIQERALTESQRSAARSLEALKKLASGDRYSFFGFQSPQEVLSATLGHGIPVFDMGNDDLRKFKSGDDPGRLLSACTRVIYPVLFGNTVRSSIEIYKSKGVWQEQGEFGNGLEASSLDNAVKSIGGFGGARFAFIAAVFAQNVYLKGRFSSAGVQLRAVPLSAQEATAGPNKSLYMEGAPSGTDLLTALSENAKKGDPGRRILH